MTAEMMDPRPRSRRWLRCGQPRCSRGARRTRRKPIFPAHKFPPEAFAASKAVTAAEERDTSRAVVSAISSAGGAMHAAVRRGIRTAGRGDGRPRDGDADGRRRGWLVLHVPPRTSLPPPARCRCEDDGACLATIGGGRWATDSPGRVCSRRVRPLLVRRLLPFCLSACLPACLPACS